MNEDISTALATVAPAVMAPTHRSPQQLAARLNQMKEERGLVATFFKDIMVDGEDYSRVQTGIDRDGHPVYAFDKPILLKPGAEKLAELYGFHPMVKNREEITDYDTGFYRCVLTMALINDAGLSVGEGVGECNTREARYFYRWVWDNQVPAGMDKTALPTRKTKKGATLYRLENDDLFSLWNTVLKMAKKRALVDVVLSVTRSSSIFSKTTKGITDWIDAEYKDISDLDDDEEDSAPISPESTKPAPAAARNSAEETVASNVRKPAGAEPAKAGAEQQREAVKIFDDLMASLDGMARQQIIVGIFKDHPECRAGDGACEITRVKPESVEKLRAWLEQAQRANGVPSEAAAST